MKRRRCKKSNFRVTGGYNFRHYPSSLLALEAAERHSGCWAEHYLNGEWKRFTVHPIPERIEALRAALERQWREEKDFYPYWITDAGEAVGVDALHATGLTLRELEKLGLLTEE